MLVSSMFSSDMSILYIEIYIDHNIHMHMYYVHNT